jgi:predicted GNAT superfamily acetyltransferase
MATGETAGKTGMIAAALTIRKCEALEEMQACFRLQKEVWEFSDAELIPVRLFVVASKIGGQVMGAFVDEELAGFADAGGSSGVPQWGTGAADEALSA